MGRELLEPGQESVWDYPCPPRLEDGDKKVKLAYTARAKREMDACWVGGEKAQAQEGDFCGGWITTDIVRPFRGRPGTWGW